MDDPGVWFWFLWSLSNSSFTCSLRNFRIPSTLLTSRDNPVLLRLGITLPHFIELTAFVAFGANHGVDHIGLRWDELAGLVRRR